MAALSTQSLVPARKVLIDGGELAPEIDARLSRVEVDLALEARA